MVASSSWRMTLSAVDTTRLSSMTMTRATDVTANVQMAIERPCIESCLLLLSSDVVTAN